MSVKELLKKEIDNLPENMITEIYDFVRFLEIRKERDLLVNASQKLSENSFEKIWDNEEDAVYDNL